MAAPLARKLSKFDFGCTTIRLFRNCLKNGCKHDRSFNTRELKKFYKNATITQSDGWFEVNLDQRKLRTPCGNLFRVPNEALALAVATEWNSQKKIINRHNMHLTSLCNTALDNPMHKTRDTLISSILHFLETDTVSFFIKEPPELYRLQKEHWGPMIQMVEERYGIQVPVIEDLASTPDLKMETVATLTKYLQSHSDWALFGYTFAVETVKSLVLTLALMDRMLTVERCVQLSRLEQDFQIERWGNVEWYHDLDLYDLQSRMAATALFVYWSNETVKIKKKSMLPASEAYVF